MGKGSASRLRARWDGKASVNFAFGALEMAQTRWIQQDMEETRHLRETYGTENVFSLIFERHKSETGICEEKPPIVSLQNEALGQFSILLI
jgi:hypothetical protein